MSADTAAQEGQRRRRPGRPNSRPERADDTDRHVETQQTMPEIGHMSA